MDIGKYLEEMKDFQRNLFDYLSEKDVTEENFEKLIKILKNQFNSQNKEQIKEILFLILHASINIYRFPGFFDRIDQLLEKIKEDLYRLFTHEEICIFFESNRRILLFFIKDDKSFYQSMVQNKLFKANISLDIETLMKHQQSGENETQICKLIRGDCYDDFIIYVNQTNTPLSAVIETSEFETNSFLIENQPTLIEYAAFYGSHQIFQFLRISGVEMTGNIWLYAMHGNNGEIIHSLEENGIHPADTSYRECLEMSVRFNSEDISSYIQSNLLKNVNDKNFLYFPYNFQYRNYCLFPETVNNSYSFYFLCKYNYVFLVRSLLEINQVNVNSMTILHLINLNKIPKLFFSFDISNIVDLNGILKSNIKSL